MFHFDLDASCFTPSGTSWHLDLLKSAMTNSTELRLGTLQWSVSLIAWAGRAPRTQVLRDDLQRSTR